MKLVPSLVATRDSFLLRLPDEYDPLQIFLQKTGSQEIGALVGGLVFSGAELPYYAAYILVELPLTAAGLSQEPVSPPSS